MDEPDQGLILPAELVHIPLRAINMTTRRKIANFLNLEGSMVVVDYDGDEFDVVNDFTGLAELAGFQYTDIMNMKQQNSPTTDFLHQWTSRNGTVGKLWQLLYLMERYDVLTDCRQNIIKDCNRFEEQQDIEQHANNFREQDPTVSTSEMKVDEFKYAIVDDVKKGNQSTMYDAFVSYSSEDRADREFVYEMIRVLEDKRGLKLFVPGRDDIPGAAEHTISAYLIEKRCKRVAILMSQSFLRSPACDFQVKFAHALAPGARSKRLIPIIREKQTQLPRILRFLAVCDFSKSDMTDWVWDRLYTAMLAPIGPITYFDDEDNSLKDMAYPQPQHRLDSYPHSSPQQRSESLQQPVTSRDQPVPSRDVDERSWHETSIRGEFSLSPSDPPSAISMSSVPQKKPKKSKFSFFDKKSKSKSSKRVEEFV